MNLRINQKGFTIVELLIVIVVIAILAAISIVAYTGIQNRANNSASQSAAVNVAKKLEAYNAVRGHYPRVGTSITTQLDDTSQGTESVLTGSGITLAGTVPTGDARRNTVRVYLCDSVAPAAHAATAGFRVYRVGFPADTWTLAQSGGITNSCAISGTNTAYSVNP